MYKSTRSILLLLRILSNNNTHTATDIINILLQPYEMWQNSEIFKGIEKEIVLNAREYFTTLTNSSKTRKRKNIQDKIDLIIHATTNNPNTERNEVYNFFNVHNMYSYKNITVEGYQTKKRKNNMHDIARKCVYEWAYNDICMRIDIN